MPNILSDINKTGVGTCKFDNLIFSYATRFNENPDDVDALAKIFVNPLVKIWITPPNKQLVICDHYAAFAFSAVIFDIMNMQATGQNSLFTSATIIAAAENTGSHMATVVGGTSGNVYLVDPWGEKVVKIPGFTEKSQWKIAKTFELRPGILFALNEKLSAEITGIYADDGYYDMAYIRPDTGWTLAIHLSDHLRQLMQTHNKVIRILYNSMNSAFGWMPYDNLFNSGNTVSLPGKPSSDTKDPNT